MTGTPGGPQPDAQVAPCRQRQAAVGRLAVDQEPRPDRGRVGDVGAVAAALLAHDEQQADADLAVRAQPLGGRHLRREDALRVARASSVQPAVANGAGEEGRHTVVVRRQHDRRVRLQRRDHVAPSVGYRLRGDRISEIAKAGNEPLAGRLLPPGRGIDVDQLAREIDNVHRRPSSSAVRASVFSSRYLTITGVAATGPIRRRVRWSRGARPAPRPRPRGSRAAPRSARMTRPFGRS